MDAIEQVIEFGLGAQLEDLPREVAERTRFAFLDTLGTMVAGIRGEGVGTLAAMAQEWGGAPQAALITGGARVPAHVAALINGVAARAWDLDDVHEQNTCHVFASVIPALLALAQAKPGVNGTEALVAAAVAGETICRLSSAPRASFSETGSSMTYQCAQYGVALMAARLLGLNHDQTRHALGIAHARLSGNQQGFLAGAMTVRLMQGVSAESGVLSALMAQRGLTGSSQILEGKFGYYPVYHRGRYERGDIVDGLGHDWLIPEISIKPASPCCKYTHAPIDAAIQARGQLDEAQRRAIESIEIEVDNREVHDLVCAPKDRKWNPESLTDAQFSLPFTVAHAVVHGKVDIGSFSDEGRSDAAVRRLMPLITIRERWDGQGDRRGTFPMPGKVRIHTASGQSVTGDVTYVKGHPRNPMTMQEVADKFQACAELGRPGWNDTTRVVRAIATLEDQRNAGALMDLLVVDTH